MGFPTLSGGTTPTGTGSSGFPQLGTGTAPGTLPGTGFSALRPDLIQDSLSPSATDKAPSVRAVADALTNLTATTNLSYTASPTGGTVASDTGTDAVLTLATGTNAGLQSPAHFSKLEGIEAGAQVNDVTSVAGRTGAVTLSAADVSGLAAVATSGAYADLSGLPTIRPGADPLTAQVFG